MPNCNLTKQEILHIEEIFGLNLGSIKGKTTRQPRQHIDIT